jgi:Flp pilus assembly pilin Flp
MPIPHIKRFLSSADAATFLEYALLGGLIAVVCVSAVTAVGTNTRELYTKVCNGVAKATGNPPCQ